jgi:hypothetical protein
VRRICVAIATSWLFGASVHAQQPAPSSLADTGLYVAGSTTIVRSDNVSFSPQYPLWSDGATKRRWLHLPAGAFIDGSQPDAWEFPRGTKLWKEFSHGRRVETRLIERLEDGTWRFSTYVWNAEGTEASLAPAEGIRGLPVDAAPGGRYVIPAEVDCRACHEGAAVPVLGVSALQLSSDRDPLAPHAEPFRHGDADLHALIERGWLRNVPAQLRDRTPRIAAPSPQARAALGYLHANCGHCHNRNGSPAPVDLALARSAIAETDYGATLRSLLDARSRYRAPGMHAGARYIDPGKPDASVLTARMRTREPLMQMPPIGTREADREALELIEQWIRNLSREETSR